MKRSALRTGLFFLLLLGLASIPMLRALGAGRQSATEQSQSASAEPERQSQVETPSEQLAQESREAAGEDTQENLKHSPSVRFISRITGLSMRGAFWLGQLLNFGVIALFIIWASKKSLPGMFRNRTVSIQKAMEEARRASEDANRRLAEIESRLSKLDVEIAEMRGAAEKETADEEARIQAAAAEDTRKIVESAEQEIASAAKQARRELTAYAADLAVTLAKQQIRVDPPTDQALVRTFASELTRNGTGPKGGR